MKRTLIRAHALRLLIVACLASAVSAVALAEDRRRCPLEALLPEKPIRKGDEGIPGFGSALAYFVNQHHRLPNAARPEELALYQRLRRRCALADPELLRTSPEALTLVRRSRLFRSAFQDLVATLQRSKAPYNAKLEERILAWRALGLDPLPLVTMRDAGAVSAQLDVFLEGAAHKPGSTIPNSGAEAISEFVAKYGHLPNSKGKGENEKAVYQRLRVLLLSQSPALLELSEAARRLLRDRPTYQAELKSFRARWRAAGPQPSAALLARAHVWRRLGESVESKVSQACADSRAEALNHFVAEHGRLPSKNAEGEAALRRTLDAALANADDFLLQLDPGALRHLRRTYAYREALYSFYRKLAPRAQLKREISKRQLALFSRLEDGFPEAFDRAAYRARMRALLLEQLPSDEEAIAAIDALALKEGRLPSAKDLLEQPLHVKLRDWAAEANPFLLQLSLGARRLFPGRAYFQTWFRRFDQRYSAADWAARLRLEAGANVWRGLGQKLTTDAAPPAAQIPPVQKATAGELNKFYSEHQALPLSSGAEPEAELRARVAGELLRGELAVELLDPEAWAAVKSSVLYRDALLGLRDRLFQTGGRADRTLDLLVEYWRKLEPGLSPFAHRAELLANVERFLENRRLSPPEAVEAIDAFVAEHKRLPTRPSEAELRLYAYLIDWIATQDAHLLQLSRAARDLLVENPAYREHLLQFRSEYYRASPAERERLAARAAVLGSPLLGDADAFDKLRLDEKDHLLNDFVAANGRLPNGTHPRERNLYFRLLEGLLRGEPFTLRLSPGVREQLRPTNLYTNALATYLHELRAAGPGAELGARAEMWRALEPELEDAFSVPAVEAKLAERLAWRAGLSEEGQVTPAMINEFVAREHRLPFKRRDEEAPLYRNLYSWTQSHTYRLIGLSREARLLLREKAWFHTGVRKFRTLTIDPGKLTPGQVEVRAAVFRAIGPDVFSPWFPGEESSFPAGEGPGEDERDLPYAAE